MRALLTAAMLMLSAAAASASDLVTTPSTHSVKETMDRLANALKEKGIAVAARIDHAAAAKANGLDLKPTELILFGNPKLGTPLMQAERGIGLELPMKVLAYEDNAGKVWVSYTKPEALKARYKVSGQDGAFTTMAGVLDGLVKAATGGGDGRGSGAAPPPASRGSGAATEKK